eukprot:scaffold58322_cov67-Phaeocystis_antarctica.AAC.7
MERERARRRERDKRASCRAHSKGEGHELHRNLSDDSSSGRELTFSPLYEAIEEATKPGSRGGRSQDVAINDLAAVSRPLPTEQQYLELSWWLARSFVEQAFEVVYYHHRSLLHNLELDQQEPKRDLKKALKTAWVEDNFDSKVSPMATHLNILFGLDEQYFHACNVNKVQQVYRVDLTPFTHHAHLTNLTNLTPVANPLNPRNDIRGITTRHRPNGSWLRSSPTRGSLYMRRPLFWLSGQNELLPRLLEALRIVTGLLSPTQAGDRLPKVTEKEGLKLLQMAWKEYDVAVHHAAFYSRLAAILRACLLWFSVIIIVFTVLYTQRCAKDDDADIIDGANRTIFADDYMRTMAAYSRL